MTYVFVGKILLSYGAIVNVLNANGGNSIDNVGIVGRYV